MIERATTPLRDDAGKVRRSALRAERITSRFPGLARQFRMVTRVPGSFGMKKTFSPERAGFKPGIMAT